MRILLLASTVIFGVTSPDTSDAASAYALANNAGCSNEDSVASGSFTVSASCSNVGASSSASAGPGRLTASALKTKPDDTTGGSGLSNGFATFSDTLFFTQEEGIFTIVFDALGSTSGFGGVLFGPGPSVQAVSEASFSARIDADFDSYVYIQNFSSGIDGNSFSTVNEGFNEVDLTFTGGSLSLSYTIQATSRCFGLDACSMFADASNSLRLAGGFVKDVNGNLVDDQTVTSDSLFDYVAGVEPHNRLEVIPLPATAWMLLAGVGALIRFGARRS